MAIFNKCSTKTFAVVAPAVAALRMQNPDSKVLVIDGGSATSQLSQQEQQNFMKMPWENRANKIDELLENSKLGEAEQLLKRWMGEVNYQKNQWLNYLNGHWEAHRLVKLENELKRKQEEHKQELLNAEKHRQWEEFESRVDQIKRLIENDKLDEADKLLKERWDFKLVPSDVVRADKTQLTQDREIALASRPFKKHLEKKEFEQAAKLLKKKKEELTESKSYDENHPQLNKTVEKWNKDLKEALLSDQHDQTWPQKADILEFSKNMKNIQEKYSGFVKMSFDDKKAKVHELIYTRKPEHLKDAGRLLTLWTHLRHKAQAWKQSHVRQLAFEELEKEHSRVRAERMIE